MDVETFISPCVFVSPMGPNSRICRRTRRFEDAAFGLWFFSAIDHDKLRTLRSKVLVPESAKRVMILNLVL